MNKKEILINFNKNKGKFILKIWLIVYLLIFIIRLMINIIPSPLPLTEIIRNNFKISIFGYLIDFDQIFIIFLVFSIFKIIDGFIDGFVINLIDITIISFILIISPAPGRFTLIIQYEIIEFFMEINLIIILLILLSGYLWILIFQTYGIIRITLHKEENNQQIKKRKKKNQKSKIHPWINRDTKEIKCEPDEKLWLKDWEPIKAEFKSSIKKFYIYDTIGLIIFGIIYAWIVFFLEERNSVYLNQTITALFLPIWYVIAVSFKSPKHYVRAWVALIFSESFQMLLYSQQIITAEGVLLVNYIIFVTSLFFLDLSPHFNSMNTIELSSFLFRIFGIIMTVTFFLMIIYKIYRSISGYEQYQLQISNKSLYFRRKRKFNYWNILGNILTTFLWPYNISSYYIIKNQLNYSRKSLSESWKWDYGKLPYKEAIKSTKRKTRKKINYIISLILLIGLFLLFLGNSISYIFLILSLRQLYVLKYKIHLKKIRIVFSRSKTMGSFFILDQDNVLQIYDIPKDLNDKIPNIRKSNSEAS